MGTVIAPASAKMATSSRASTLQVRWLAVCTATIVLVVTPCWIVSFLDELPPKPHASGCSVKRTSSECAPSRKRSKSWQQVNQSTRDGKGTDPGGSKPRIFEGQSIKRQDWH